MRRLPVFEVAVALAIGIVALAGVLVYGAVAGNPGGHTWTAEFTNARGLVAGNDVRDDGAVVGRVSSISLSRAGTALVHFQLSNAQAVPRADAVAAIEPADLLGDTYMSLSPGSSSQSLHGPITAAHTVNAPRLDQVLDEFQPNVRDGLQVLLFEGGLALDQRGGSLARATVALRPALHAAQGVLGELDTQNGSLARLIPVAQQAAAQLDSRRSELGPLIDQLAASLNATAGAASPLGRGLAGLPSTLAQLRSTGAGLAATATAATPLVQRLEPVTAPLESVTSGLPALLKRVRAAAPTFDRALAQARSTLSTAAPSLSQLSKAFPVLRSQAPGISTLLSELDAAAPGIAEGFFVDFPDQADESGQQPFDPFAEPTRAYWRGAAVFSCEAFGVPVAPGCLTKAIANLERQALPASVTRQAGASRLLDYLLKP